MNLAKRDCGIRMRLVPYEGGWTDEGEEREVIIPDGVKAIDGYAYSEKNRVVIPDSVETIGYMASGCTGLVGVSISSGVETMHPKRERIKTAAIGCGLQEEVNCRVNKKR